MSSLKWSSKNQNNVELLCDVEVFRWGARFPCYRRWADADLRDAQRLGTNTGAVRQLRGCEQLLTRGSGPRGEVWDPEGRPAPGVSVARVNGTWGDPLNHLQFDPAHGLLSVIYPYEHLKFATDAAGRFELPAFWGGGIVFMISTQGFAFRAVRELATNPVVTLARYGRITGRLVGASDRIADQQLHLGFARTSSFDIWFRNAVLRTVTDAEGRFSFDPVPPGNLEILQLIPYAKDHESWTSKTLHQFELQPGQSLSLELQPARPDGEPVPRSSPKTNCGDSSGACWGPFPRSRDL